MHTTFTVNCHLQRTRNYHAAFYAFMTERDTPAIRAQLVAFIEDLQLSAGKRPADLSI